MAGPTAVSSIGGMPGCRHRQHSDYRFIHRRHTDGCSIADLLLLRLADEHPADQRTSALPPPPRSRSVGSMTFLLDSVSVESRCSTRNFSYAQVPGQSSLSPR